MSPRFGSSGMPYPHAPRLARVSDPGFSLVEFLIASLLLTVLAASVFVLLGQMQRAAARYSEVQGVVDGMRMAVLTLRRILEQAGNDPSGSGLSGIRIISAESVQVRSDLTGSGGSGAAAEGDPDGDVDDPGEDITIRYDAVARSLDLGQAGGAPQALIDQVASFRMEYFDRHGAETRDGNAVRMVRITMIGASTVAGRQPGEAFGIRLSTDVRLPGR